MLCFPNCKINLGLYVTGRRADGYHDIETIFYPVSIAHASVNGAMRLHDVLEAVPVSSAAISAKEDASAIRLHTSGLAVAGNGDDNLVVKAVHLLKKRFPSIITGLDIYLSKNIPMGAGLGGGSADGAFMLRLLNDYFQLKLSKTELAGLALQLGSDCPFFIYNTPQFASGRGEQMTNVNLDLSAYSIQVICPHVHVATAKAFSLITPHKAAYDLRKLEDLPVEIWKDTISNDFEMPVFKQHPVLAEIKQQLYAQGAIYAAMSGSGSAIYGLFSKGNKAEIKVGIGFDGFFLE